MIGGFLISALALIFIRNTNKFKSIFLTYLVFPYLIGSCMVQSGLLTDRSRNIRETIEVISNTEDLYNHSINVIDNNYNVANSTSKLIKILLVTPKLGKDLKNVNELKPNEYAWMIESDINKSSNPNYEVVVSDKSLNPWTLIKKKM
tara:strand:- start:73 stop:513 length:441 start_codon:yes stop_codon:yes gene_type:complete